VPRLTFFIDEPRRLIADLFGSYLSGAGRHTGARFRCDVASRRFGTICIGSSGTAAMRLVISNPEEFAWTCLDQRMSATVRQVEGVALDINRIVCKATASAMPERPSVTGRSFAAREGGLTSCCICTKRTFRIISCDDKECKLCRGDGFIPASPGTSLGCCGSPVVRAGLPLWHAWSGAWMRCLDQHARCHPPRSRHMRPMWSGSRKRSEMRHLRWHGKSARHSHWRRRSPRRSPSDELVVQVN
jgi:hypothetical protein